MVALKSGSSQSYQVCTFCTKKWWFLELSQRACLFRAQMPPKVLWQPYVPRNKTPFSQKKPYGETENLDFFRKIFRIPLLPWLAWSSLKRSISQLLVLKISKFFFSMETILNLEDFWKISIFTRSSQLDRAAQSCLWNV